MFLEQTEAGEVVHVIGERVNDVSQPAFQIGILLRSLQSSVEHLKVHVERVLVHGVDHGQRGHDEEEDGTPLRNWSVLDAGELDLLCSNLGLLEVLGDVLRFGLGVLKRLDQLLVVEDVALSGAQLLEQCVLQLLEQHRAVGHILDELLALFF